MSLFPLVNFVEFVESPESEQIMLKINALQKSRKLLLKIAPIEVLKFGGAGKLPYLAVDSELMFIASKTGPVFSA